MAFANSKGYSVARPCGVSRVCSASDWQSWLSDGDWLADALEARAGEVGGSAGERSRAISRVVAWRAGWAIRRKPFPAVPPLDAIAVGVSGIDALARHVANGAALLEALKGPPVPWASPAAKAGDTFRAVMFGAMGVVAVAFVGAVGWAIYSARGGRRGEIA